LRLIRAAAMADESTNPFPTGTAAGADRPDRSGANREGGGFRIRLSDNEMRAARAIQEAFGLRSTVAVLGFSLRTLAQQLEDGQLEELVARHRSQPPSRGPGARRDDRRRERGEGRPGRGPRVDPFARPARPGAAVAEPEVIAAAAAEAQPEEPAPAAAETATAETAATETVGTEAVVAESAAEDGDRDGAA
jgi:hypothetical protein